MKSSRVQSCLHGDLVAKNDLPLLSASRSDYRQKKLFIIERLMILRSTTFLEPPPQPLTWCRWLGEDTIWTGRTRPPEIHVAVQSGRSQRCGIWPICRTSSRNHIWSDKPHAYRKCFNPAGQKCWPGTAFFFFFGASVAQEM